MCYTDWHLLENKRNNIARRPVLTISKVLRVVFVFSSVFFFFCHLSYWGTTYYCWCLHNESPWRWRQYILPKRRYLTTKTTWCNIPADGNLEMQVIFSVSRPSRYITDIAPFWKLVSELLWKHHRPKRVWVTSEPVRYRMISVSNDLTDSKQSGYESRPDAVWLCKQVARLHVNNISQLKLW